MKIRLMLALALSAFAALVAVSQPALPVSTALAVKPLVVGISESFPEVEKGKTAKIQVNASYHNI